MSKPARTPLALVAFDSQPAYISTDTDWGRKVFGVYEAALIHIIVWFADIDGGCSTSK